MPGRTYVKKVTAKTQYLREDRLDGAPLSFQKLNMFLKTRRLKLTDFLLDTTEVEAGSTVSQDETEVDRDDDPVHLEHGPEGQLCESEPEYYTDDDEDST